MTIKVEREALLRVLSRKPSDPSLLPPCELIISTDHGAAQGDEYVLVDIPKPLEGEDQQYWSTYGVDNDDCDDRSLYTSSTDSLSNYSDDPSSLEKRVSFAAPLVTEEWTRPRTPPSDVAKLFYSAEQTQRFRQEYRLERKLINELAIDPESFPAGQEELSKLIASTPSQSSSSPSRHRISRVVVLHNDKLETFVNADETSTPCADDVTPSYPPLTDLFAAPSGAHSDDPTFFDNDSFWSGSLTWY